jgi:hypothetical protein
METIKSEAKVAKAVRTLTASALIASFVLMPATSSAGLMDKVTELKNKVQAKVENVKGKIDDLDGENLEEFLETVKSMVRFVKQSQADYKTFVGDKCGASSPCGMFRTEFRKTIESFMSLPHQLHFIEHVPPAARKLGNVVKLIDIMPPPILYASEKVLGNAFEELQYRLELVRYAAAQVPRFPTMAELSDASVSSSVRVTANDKGGSPNGGNRPSNTPPPAAAQEPFPEFPYCNALLNTGKPHIDLLAKTLEHVGDFVWDLADTMEDSKTVGVSPGATSSVKNPTKGMTQTVGLVIKSIRQVVEITVAATASICAQKGYKAPAN